MSEELIIHRGHLNFALADLSCWIIDLLTKLYFLTGIVAFLSAASTIRILLTGSIQRLKNKRKECQGEKPVEGEKASSYGCFFLVLLIVVGCSHK